jgi:hypothetical protein
MVGSGKPGGASPDNQGIDLENIMLSHALRLTGTSHKSHSAAEPQSKKC